MTRTQPPALLLAPALAFIIGLAYICGDPSRTSSPSYDAAKEIAPMHVWGCVFLAGGFAMLGAWAADNNRLVAWSLWIGGAVYAWWGACFAMQAMTDKHSSLTAWALYAAISAFHFTASRRAWMTR